MPWAVGTIRAPQGVRVVLGVLAIQLACDRGAIWPPNDAAQDDVAVDRIGSPGTGGAPAGSGAAADSGAGGGDPEMDARSDAIDGVVVDASPDVGAPRDGADGVDAGVSLDAPALDGATEGGGLADAIGVDTGVVSDAGPSSDGGAGPDDGGSRDAIVPADGGGDGASTDDSVLRDAGDMADRDGGEHDGSVSDAATSDAAPSGASGGTPDSGLDLRGDEGICSAGLECKSGFCVDGTCCDTVCAGPCVACNLPGSVGVCVPVPHGSADPRGWCRPEPACGMTGICDGQGGCALWMAGTVCAVATCVDGLMHTQAFCDGQGTCVPGPLISCAPEVCNSLGTACNRGCPSGDAICVGQTYCAGDEECMPKKADGASCGSNHECLSNSCASGCCGGICLPSL